MDHKVSKDMISSGMTPSGEKTQADLGRTQYGSVPSPSKLMDAYKSIYEHHQKDADGKVIEHGEKEELNEGKMPEGLKNYLMKKGKKDDKKEDKKEKVDENTLLKGIQTVDRGRENLAKGIGNVASTVGSDIKSAASTVYKDVKNAIKNRYQKFKDHQKARGMGLDLKKGRISPSGVYSSTTPGGGFSSYDLRFDTDLFDLVKGDLINEGLTDGEASKMMLEMHEEITFLYNLSESDKEELNELLGGIKGDGYIGHPNARIKNPFAKQQIKKPVMPNAKPGSGGLLNRTAGKLGDRKMELQKLMKGM